MMIIRKDMKRWTEVKNKKNLKARGKSFLDSDAVDHVDEHHVHQDDDDE